MPAKRSHRENTDPALPPPSYLRILLINATLSIRSCNISHTHYNGDLNIKPENLKLVLFNIRDCLNAPPEVKKQMFTVAKVWVNPPDRHTLLGSLFCQELRFTSQASLSLSPLRSPPHIPRFSTFKIKKKERRSALPPSPHFPRRCQKFDSASDRHPTPAPPNSREITASEGRKELGKGKTFVSLSRESTRLSSTASDHERPGKPLERMGRGAPDAYSREIL